MAQIQPTTVEPVPLSLAAPRSSRGGVHVPRWLRLLLRNPKSRFGLVVLACVIVAALIAPLVATHDPNAFSLLDARQGPSRHHLCREQEDLSHEVDTGPCVR